jgi:hypothetical protein
MRTLRSFFLVLALGTMAFSQTSSEKKSTPANPNDPGSMKPLPLPRQAPTPIPPDAKNPEVREPVHETGKERPVSGKTGAKAKSGAKSSKSTSSAPAETPRK